MAGGAVPLTPPPLPSRPLWAPPRLPHIGSPPCPSARRPDGRGAAAAHLRPSRCRALGLSVCPACPALPAASSLPVTPAALRALTQPDGAYRDCPALPTVTLLPGAWPALPGSDPACLMRGKLQLWCTWERVPPLAPSPALPCPALSRCPGLPSPGTQMAFGDLLTAHPSWRAHGCFVCGECPLRWAA